MTHLRCSKKGDGKKKKVGNSDLSCDEIEKGGNERKITKRYG